MAGEEKRNPERMRELEDREPLERDLESLEVGWKRFVGSCHTRDTERERMMKERKRLLGSLALHYKCNLLLAF